MKPYKKLSVQEQRYFDILVHDLEYCGLLSEADSVLVTRTAKSLSLLDKLSLINYDVFVEIKRFRKKIQKKLS